MPLEQEALIDLDDAVEVYEERTRHRPNRATVFRHALDGILSPAGERVYLEHIRVGRRIYTSRQAIERFWVASSNASNRRARSRTRNERCQA